MSVTLSVKMPSLYVVAAPQGQLRHLENHPCPYHGVQPFEFYRACGMLICTQCVDAAEHEFWASLMRAAGGAKPVRGF